VYFVYDFMIIIIKKPKKPKLRFLGFLGFLKKPKKPRFFKTQFYSPDHDQATTYLFYDRANSHAKTS